MFKNARSANSHSPFPVSLQRRQPFFTFFLFTVSFQRRQPFFYLFPFLPFPFNSASPFFTFSPFYRFLSTAPALFLPFSLFTVSFQRRQPFFTFLPFYPFTFLPLNIFHHFLQPVYCVRQILSEAVVCEQIMAVSGREGRVEGCVHFFDILRDGIFYIVLLPIHGRMFIHAPFLMEKAERLFHAVFRYLLRVFCAHDSLLLNASCLKFINCTFASVV